MAKQSSLSVTAWVIGSTLLFLLGLWLYQLFGPNPKIIVSKQTTYLTTPLKANGLPDYAAALRATQKEGVTPETNGALPFWRAMWPTDLDERFTAEEAKLLCDEMGLSSIPDGSEAVSNYYGAEMATEVIRWLVAQHPTNETEELISEAELVEAWNQLQQDYASSNSASSGFEMVSTPEQLRRSEFVSNWLDIGLARPWTKGDLPFMAEWLSSNKEALNLLVEAANKPHWYSPNPSTLRPGQSSLLEGSFVQVQQLRQTARVLSIRAMHRLGNKKHAEAWQDFHACWLLAGKTAKNEFLVNQLVSFAIGGIAIENTKLLLSDPSLPETVANQIANDLKKLPPVVDLGRCYGFAERLYTTEVSIGLANQEDAAEDYAVELATNMLDTSLDWNVVLIELQDHYDRLSSAYQKQDYHASRRLLKQIDADIQSKLDESALGSSLISRQARSENTAATLLQTMFYSLKQLLDIERSFQTKRELVTVAARVVAFERQQGSYPESLEALSSEGYDPAKIDPYSRQPFRYKKVADGFLLYSCGPNGVDDGGSRHDESTWPSQEVYEGEPLPDPYNSEDEAEYRRLIELIPIGADDISLRFPIKLRPWPEMLKREATAEGAVETE